MTMSHVRVFAFMANCLGKLLTTVIKVVETPMATTPYSWPLHGETSFVIDVMMIVVAESGWNFEEYESAVDYLYRFQ